MFDFLCSIEVDQVNNPPEADFAMLNMECMEFFFDFSVASVILGIEVGAILIY